MELCQLGEVWSKPEPELSRGFRQRVGLAQAMLHDPKVLILDEPTLGLDPNQIAVVREMIRGFAKDKAVLISTHILQEVEAMADTVMLVNEGRLKFNGPIADLTADGTLESKFRALTEGCRYESRSHARCRGDLKRQLWSLLGNPLGYVFVLAFVLIYGGFAFSSRRVFCEEYRRPGSSS